MDWSRYYDFGSSQHGYGATNYSGGNSSNFGLDVDEEMPYDDLDPSNHVYHEKQDGMLCLRHALNALLQYDTFDEVRLGEIGTRLDESERQLMMLQDGGMTSNAHGSKEIQCNVSDDGNFSVQVMIQALQERGLYAFSYSSPESEGIRHNPETQTGFICNLQSHWFAIRKIGQKWFNLNSSFRRARQISDTYLSLFLTQLLSENYSVYVVTGSYPPYDKEELIQALPDRIYVPPNKQPQQQRLQHALTSYSPSYTNTYRQYSPVAPYQTSTPNEEDEQIRLAIERSLENQ